jgi:arylsulfatase A-like enzyme
VFYKVTSPNAGDSYVLADGQKLPTEVTAADQYLLRSFLGGNAPDVVAFCTEDAAFVKKGGESWKGNHGGATWDSQHMPLILYGPGIRSGVVSHAPARLQDIAPTALALFGIKATGMQGTVLADAFITPTSQQTSGETQLDRVLIPVTSALADQSRAELAADK